MPKEPETVNEQFNKFLQSNFSISQFDKTQSLTEQQNQIKEAFAKLCDMRGSIKKYMEEYATELKQIYINRQSAQEQNSDRPTETPDTDSNEITEQEPTKTEEVEEPPKVKRTSKVTKKNKSEEEVEEPPKVKKVVKKVEEQEEVEEPPKVKKVKKVVKKTEDEENEPRKVKKSVKKVNKN